MLQQPSRVSPFAYAILLNSIIFHASHAIPATRKIVWLRHTRVCIEIVRLPGMLALGEASSICQPLSRIVGTVSHCIVSHSSQLNFNAAFRIHLIRARCMAKYSWLAQNKSGVSIPMGKTS